MARRIRSVGILVVVSLVALFVLAPLASAAPARQDPTGTVDASDQAIVGGEITVAKITAGQDGWIVAHLDEGGKPGKVIGETLIKAGDSSNVKIKLSEDVPVGGKLWPMLHIDAGTIGTYEFPGPDAPVVANGAPVMKQITVTAAATSAPANLPKTGGAEDNSSVLLIGALALLAAGALLVLRMRRA
jgi:LPXTG-motif cell wall-anchored protein